MAEPEAVKRALAWLAAGRDGDRGVIEAADAARGDLEAAAAIREDVGLARLAVAIAPAPARPRGAGRTGGARPRVVSAVPDGCRRWRRADGERGPGISSTPVRKRL